MARKPDPPRVARTPKPTLIQRLRGDFLTGLVVVLPMFLTGYLLWATIAFVDAKVIPLIPGRYNPENVFGRNIFGLGLIVFLIFTTLRRRADQGPRRPRDTPVRRAHGRAHAGRPRRSTTG